MTFEEWFEKFQESVKNRSHLDGEEWAKAAWDAAYEQGREDQLQDDAEADRDEDV